jgi:hypothetical protein
VIIKVLGAGRVSEVIECLPSDLEVLSSNPSTAKKKKMFFLLGALKGLNQIIGLISFSLWLLTIISQSIEFWLFFLNCHIPMQPTISNGDCF